MRPCRDTRYALSWWRPATGRELPERIATHLDRCPRCSLFFDTLYVPIRLLRPAPRTRGFADVGVLAAAAALVLFPITWQPSGVTPEDEVSIQPDAEEACVMIPEEDLCDPLEEAVSPA